MSHRHYCPEHDHHMPCGKDPCVQHMVVACAAPQRPAWDLEAAVVRALGQLPVFYEHCPDCRTAACSRREPVPTLAQLTDAARHVLRSLARDARAAAP